MDAIMLASAAEWRLFPVHIPAIVQSRPVTRSSPNLPSLVTLLSSNELFSNNVPYRNSTRKNCRVNARTHYVQKFHFVRVPYNVQFECVIGIHIVRQQMENNDKLNGANNITSILKFFDRPSACAHSNIKLYSLIIFFLEKESKTQPRSMSCLSQGIQLNQRKDVSKILKIRCIC